MRIALTTALMMVAAIALADEPNTVTAQAEAAAEATPEQAAPAAEEAASAEAASAETASAETAAPTEEPAATEDAADDGKPFKVPAGYRAKTVEGKPMYCTKVVVLGSRFGKESCRTEAQLRELERQKKGQMEQQVTGTSAKKLSRRLEGKHHANSVADECVADGSGGGLGR
jgi:hypothetical protein